MKSYLNCHPERSLARRGVVEGSLWLEALQLKGIPPLEDSVGMTKCIDSRLRGNDGVGGGNDKVSKNDRNIQ